LRRVVQDFDIQKSYHRHLDSKEVCAIPKVIVGFKGRRIVFAEMDARVSNGWLVNLYTRWELQIAVPGVCLFASKGA
jgi:hypothetical protein